jgi:hypothetical protein
MNGFWTETLYNYLKPRTLSGTADIDISTANYATGFVEILKIEPRAAIRDMVIYLDFDKETTGVNDVATNNDTLDAQVFTKVDGTVYVATEAMTQKTLTGTFGLAVGGGWAIKLGALDTTQDISIRVKISAERADAEIPYRIVYCSELPPTVTAVAAA